MTSANFDFEWDLSKENVKPLSTGRSVPQLNMVLAFQKSPIFTHWCKSIRRRFENALLTCPSERKIYLYGKYIRWIEQTYPSLGAASKYRSVLYRCVKDTCCIPGVHNHPIYVATWIKLMNYCDSASELFNLLFNKGVGTLNADFYVAWTDHIQQLPEKSSNTEKKKWARVASIFAHGLRAGAKPHYLLEDKAECFVGSVVRAERLVGEKKGFEKLISEPQGMKESMNAEERQTLAQLRTIDAEGESSIVPRVRTGTAINPERRGLRGLRPRLQDVHPQKPRPGLQILRDPTPLSDLPNLSNVQPISGSLGKTLARIAEPVSLWNVENAKAPCVRLDRRTAMSSVSTSTCRSSAGPSKQPLKLTIFKDVPEEVASSPESSQRLHSQMTVTSRTRGLRLAGVQGGTRHQNAGGHILSLEKLRSALPGEATLDSKEGVQEEEEFNIHDQEVNFEMNREIMTLESSLSPTSSKKKMVECFSLNLDDPISRSILQDIERTVSSEDEGLEDSLLEAEQTAKRNGCTELIKQLEAIVTKYTNN